MLVLSRACVQTRQQSICVRHEDVVDNTTTWLMDFQEQFGLATKPGFPIEVPSPARPKACRLLYELVEISSPSSRRRETAQDQHQSFIAHRSLCMGCREGLARHHICDVQSLQVRVDTA